MNKIEQTVYSVDGEKVHVLPAQLTIKSLLTLMRIVVFDVHSVCKGKSIEGKLMMQVRGLEDIDDLNIDPRDHNKFKTDVATYYNDWLNDAKFQQLRQ